MKWLKVTAAAMMSLGLVSMAPQATCAANGACQGCYNGCLQTYGDDLYLFTQCLDHCVDENGIPCQSDAGG